MKKILLTAYITMLGAFNANAQFKIKPEGIVTDEGKSFYVVKVDSVSKEELFKRCESYVMKTYKNPDIVMSKQGNDMITIHGMDPRGYKYESHWLNMEYTITVSFKDGRIRIDAPNIIDASNDDKTCRLVAGCGAHVALSGVWYLYDRKGRVRIPKHIEKLSSWINIKVGEIVDAIKCVNKEDQDW